ncbi:MAG: DNA polymerase III subunit beta [Candidatus Yanofskybacteria bacterium]|nr:DNA polymerase III subunit beta [Candidatus Yanofskybacteria bacterium]
MKLIVGQKNFKRALGIVERIVSKNVALPILNNILLKTEQGRLKISTTNLEIGTNVLIGAKIDEVGEIAVPGRILSDLVGNLYTDNITLTTKSNSLFIQTDHIKTKILGFDTKEYPIIPRIKDDPITSIPGKVLKNAFTTMFDSIAISETRPELAGLFMQFKENQLVLAATDSFRLTEKMIEAKSKHTHSVIVPKNTVAELIRISGEAESDIEIRISDNQISFAGEDFELLSRLIDGNYPDYAKVIPEKFVSKALVETQLLEQNIRLAGLFSSSIADIKIDCKENEMSINAKNSDKGEMETAVPIVLKSEPFEIALNFHYLLDGLKIMNSDKVIVEFTGVGSPLVLRPAQEKSGLVYLIMPLRN